MATGCESGHKFSLCTALQWIMFFPCKCSFDFFVNNHNIKLTYPSNTNSFIFNHRHQTFWRKKVCNILIKNYLKENRSIYVTYVNILDVVLFVKTSSVNKASYAPPMMSEYFLFCSYLARVWNPYVQRQYELSTMLVSVLSLCQNVVYERCYT